MKTLMQRLHDAHMRTAMEYRETYGYEGNTENLTSIYREALEEILRLRAGLTDIHNEIPSNPYSYAMDVLLGI